MLEEHDDVGLVWITNPTYEGVMSDIGAIAKICQKYNVPLVVDEAHACLWYFSDKLPTGALELGADAVLHSLHKTGGSMSQSSMMHIAHNSKLDVTAVEKALKLVQTTSPSLLLLASLDAARANLQSPCGREHLEQAIANAQYLRAEIDKMQRINHLPHTDITKVFIKADGLSGVQLESILEIDFGIEVESAFEKGLLLLSNIGNSRGDMEYLVQALKKIDETEYKEICEEKRFMPLLEPVIKMSLREAFFAQKETVAKSDAVGRIAAEVIAECPPGIAVLLPGELITEAHLPYLTDYGFIDVVK
jgi:lysine decarboxylase